MLVSYKDIVVLGDEEVNSAVDMKVAIELMEGAVISKSSGNLTSPPRFQFNMDKGSLVFTCGALHQELSETFGFRVYSTVQTTSKGETQATLIFDGIRGVIEGVIVGNKLGAVRTGALGGVAIKMLAKEDASVVGVLGSGIQAETQLMACLAVRTVNKVKVYSPNASHRETFVRKFQTLYTTSFQAVHSAKECVEGVDILLVATNSDSPVFETSWLSPGVHINSVGPKFAENHELPADLPSYCSIVATDSLAQIDAYAKRHFIRQYPSAMEPKDLSQLVGKSIEQWRTSQDITLFCSVGLAGTEVILGNEVIRRCKNKYSETHF